MPRPVEARPVRVANCSGYHGDPAYEMYRQATLGDVDFITGDYLAEVNLANNAQAWREGKHPGYEPTAWHGLQQTIDVIAQKGIRVVINGGALDPKALALKVEQLVSEKNLSLRVAYLSGDDMYPALGPNMPSTKDALRHLDSGNPSAAPSGLTYAFLNNNSGKPAPMVSAHAYLGARGIVDGLRRGADIIICGRVADASPVIAAAWFWHDWSATDYDQLAGSLIAGHLIECSAYVTGGNFAGFDDEAKYNLDNLVVPGFPIADINQDGTCVVTKHPGTGGMVNVDTVRCQFLYELQGTTYLNSDVSAHLKDILIEDAGVDRVRVSGIRGSPPPPTTKCAIFYHGGYEAQLLLNATGSATAKWDLFEKQLRHFISADAAKDLETLEFQRVGVPAANPRSQLESTTYLRVFAASRNVASVLAVSKALGDISLKHFSGFHTALDMRTAIPRPFLAYYPAVIAQSSINETINFIDGPQKISSFDTGHPPQYSPADIVNVRESYDPEPEPEPEHNSSSKAKPTRLGTLALGRSGDKGGNLNVGLFPTTNSAAHWSWLRRYMTISRMRELIGEDWDESYYIERVEFPRIRAVHFVVYGILGRGVSSSSRLDGFGKGFVDFIRDRVVEGPVGLGGSKI
ncbi:hypothetical protein ASPVEDRAFT_42091 [Aspergillus versicolor CBS 583.65]|uniref:DUF1446 domain-containing protein n=1 Tax=Aspergillus versicolor CBS 583.65 TaxID=1036611 RepID=A0A1L9PMB9_ASPVE|nr:uncharacterized protein ASPVEDRAFT_42091 [Aspergillus versicolor CBS 583.65]OJJ02586.1 hypothetical protein ASPVEDRAFT_42091 [Aspergillus versicolor CBS 583.65]